MSRAVSIILIIILILVIIAGAGGTYYFWNLSQQKAKQVSDNQQQINDLNQKVTDLNNQLKTAQTTLNSLETKSNSETGKFLTISQLGIKIPLTTQIADLDYTVNTDGSVKLSSLSLRKACHSWKAGLGRLSKVKGTSTKNTDPSNAYISNTGYEITKQFSGSYILYDQTSPQACSEVFANKQKAYLEGIVNVVPNIEATK